MDIFDFINEDNHWLPKKNFIEPTEKIKITLPAQQEIFSAITTSPHIEDTMPCATFSPLTQDGHISHSHLSPKISQNSQPIHQRLIFTGNNPDE